MRPRWTTATLFGVLVLSAVLIADAHAQRGGRAGGGAAPARGGVASSGSFSTGSATAGTRPSQLPADGRGDWDAGNRAPAVVAGAVIGATAAARRGYGASGAYYNEALTTLPCTPKEINAGSIKYYQCGNDYFMQTYDGGSVVYVQVDPPAQQ